MAGQAHHFLKYAPGMDPPNVLPYAQNRYRNEVGRLYSVLDRRLADRDFVAGAYSIADMAIWPWANGWQGQQQDIDQFPHMKAWLARVWERPAVQPGRAVAQEQRSDLTTDREAQKVLFGQAARSLAGGRALPVAHAKGRGIDREARPVPDPDHPPPGRLAPAPARRRDAGGRAARLAALRPRHRHAEPRAAGGDGGGRPRLPRPHPGGAARRARTSRR